jgi:hypothetical protein
METSELEREVEALDRLADKREELESGREATALAADHHHQREEERRWEEMRLQFLTVVGTTVPT